jgi:hypothetical protein
MKVARSHRLTNAPSVPPLASSLHGSSYESVRTVIALHRRREDRGYTPSHRLRSALDEVHRLRFAAIAAVFCAAPSRCFPAM